MSKRKHDPELYADFASRGLSNYQIAAEFGVDESSVRRGLRALGYQRHLVPLDIDDRLQLHLDRPIKIEGDLMVTADWHIPLYDPALVNEVIETGREQGLTSLLIAGDFFNFDALSHYDPKQDGAGLAVELNESVAVMRVLLQTFDTIYYLWGNHDARLHKALGFSMKFREAMKLVFGNLGREALDRIQFSNLDHCWLDTGDQFDWYICHPQSYNRAPLSTARKLAAKENAHVITAHAHHCAAGYAEDGKKVVAEAGGLFDVTKTAYLQRSTTHPNWTQGFGFIKDGRLTLKSPGWVV